jgi:hypothetical protein
MQNHNTTKKGGKLYKMIGIDEEIGITHPDIKECDRCGSQLSKVEIENHGQGGWFNAVECDNCGKRFNITKFTQEDYRKLRNRLNRQISALKRTNLKDEENFCDNCDKRERDCLCLNENSLEHETA